MRIDQTDIDDLVSLSVWLKTTAHGPDENEFDPLFDRWYRAVKKVYIMLLPAVGRGQLEFKDVVKRGIGDDTPAANAIRALCP